ncbi:hypothetical protein J437_LFUL015633 [Ladona fulva]|uniref:Uncharacterized protein n=1 Tax=Ladona fulva TaxID=123851 RepID=A0A8K0KL39_LADFU|nr:hypothetical protein J437_LFUL015633 [Ladona fulva]
MSRNEWTRISATVRIVNDLVERGNSARHICPLRENPWHSLQKYLFGNYLGGHVPQKELPPFSDLLETFLTSRGFRIHQIH